MKKTRLLLFSIIGVAILQSCIKTNDFNKMASPTYNGEWAVPIATSHITLRDVLKDSAMHIDGTGLVSLSYNVKNLSSTTADQLMKIPNQSLPQVNYTIPTTIPGTGFQIDLSQGKQYTVPFSSDIPLTLADPSQKLDSIYIKAGTISIPIKTDFNKSALITIDAPNIIKRSTRQKIVIPPISVSKLAPNSTANIDISDCILILKTVGGVSNTIHFDISTTMTGDPQPLPSSYNFNMAVGINNLQFASLYGNLGQFHMNLSQSVDISVFKTNLGGGFQFGPGAINLNVKVDNSFGLPIQLNTTTFNAHSDINTPHDVPIKLFGSTSPNIFNIGAPTVFGQSQPTYVVSTNPNISDAFNISPNKIILVADAVTNPTGSNNHNFVSDKSSINVNMGINLNFFASIKDFAFQDTLSFDLSNTDKLESVSFKINTTNGFPLGVQLQVFFTDETYHQLDAMFASPQEILKPGILSGPAGDYKTITPTDYPFPDITYDKARLLKIKNAKKIILKAILNTPNSGTSLIKLYDSYFFDSKIAIKAKANLQSK